MAGADAWMPLYIGDYAADTGHLGMAEHGAYLLLIMHYWRTGPLPDDERALARIARADRKDWVKVSPIVREFFKAENGKLHHKRIDKELAAASNNVEQRRAAANARWERARKSDASNPHDPRNTDVDPHAHAPASSAHDPRILPSPDVLLPSSPSSSSAKQAAAREEFRGRQGVNGAGPSPRWDDAAIEPGQGDHPTVNGFKLDWTFNEALDAANMDPARSKATWKPVIAWLKDGIEPATILAAIHRCAERADYEPPRSLAYFDRPVREEKPH